MGDGRKHTTRKKSRHPAEKESIEELKNRIRHQKDALNKIIENIQNKQKSKD